jgi:undecaprenyl-diphosphatase
MFLQIDFPNWLVQWDQWLFTKINGQFTNGFFDQMMPFMRTALNWAPLYIFLIAFALVNFRSKGGWWVLFMLATVALTDMTGTYLFKHNFERIRPCGDPDFGMYVRLLVDRCSTGHSFTSNHAANHMGMATFFFITTRKWLGKWAVLGLVWAGLIGYAQIYVGVHYPFDVLVGSLIGILLGTLTGQLYIKRYGFVIFEPQSTVTS